MNKPQIATLCLIIVQAIHSQSLPTSKQAWGIANQGVQISISLDNPIITVGQPVDFYISFKNLNKNEVVLKLGSIVGNVQIPEAIQLLVMDERGKKKQFHVSDRRFGELAARIDDFLVPISPGEIYKLKLNSSLFFCRESAEFGLSLNPGKYRIKAIFVGIGTRMLYPDLENTRWYHDRVLTNLWEGQLESSELRFQCRQVPKTHQNRKGLSSLLHLSSAKGALAGELP
jgi:hypothetical protein